MIDFMYQTNIYSITNQWQTNRNLGGASKLASFRPGTAGLLALQPRLALAVAGG